MKLIRNWRAVMLRAWSMRLMFAAGLLSGVEVALPFFSAALPAGVFAGLSFATVAAAFVARLMAQKDLTP